jgi:hypothetical protein
VGLPGVLEATWPPDVLQVRAVAVVNQSEFEDRLAAIEERLDDIHERTKLLLALRILEDGHAPDMHVALAFARDPDRLRKLYPQVRS